ncbi:MAG: hypothetical protein NTV51_02740 [Verrucomicrobia bacterium]|nr:hypothetical protein [Verrucomicrobiota bacterium]
MTSWPDPRALRPVLVLLAAVSLARAEDTFYAKRVAPILEEKCVLCHGEKKQKGKLRLDSFEWLMKGGENGAVVTPGDAKDSELHVRVTLQPEDEDFMPADNKPPLTPDEVKVLAAWIAAGASKSAPLSSIKGAPAAAAPQAPATQLAPDWRPRAAQIAELEKTLGLRLTPRSTLATDGLVLRTASAPTRCDDAALARLKPVADLIVEAELARTKITDAGLASLAACANLRTLDLTRTAVTSAGLAKLTGLKQLESINLTSTAVDDTGVAQLQRIPTLKKTWLFDTRVSVVEEAPVRPAK